MSVGWVQKNLMVGKYENYILYNNRLQLTDVAGYIGPLTLASLGSKYYSYSMAESYFQKTSRTYMFLSNSTSFLFSFLYFGKLVEVLDTAISEIKFCPSH